MRFCPFCGAELETLAIDGRDRGACMDCWFGDWGHHTLAIGAVILDDRHRVLLGRWAETSSRGMWGLSSGFVESDEVLHAAVEREALEELSVQVEASHIVAVRSIVEERSTNTYIVFAARHIGGTPTADQVEFSDARWFTKEALDAATDVTPVTKQIALAVLDLPAHGLHRRPYSRPGKEPTDLHIVGGVVG